IGAQETKTLPQNLLQKKRRPNLATATVEKLRTGTRKKISVQALMYVPVLTLYRVFAMVTLYAVLAGVLGYGFVVGFYAINTSWAAPVILSPADDKSIDFTQKLVTSKQTLEEVSLDRKRLESSLSEMALHRASLLALEP